MEYVTIVIRWGCTPNEHIGFITDSLRQWYLSRWTYTDAEIRSLTAMCLYLPEEEATGYTERLLRVMRNLWVDQACNIMVQGDFEALLEDTTALSVIANTYTVTHADVTPALSFYQHVRNTEALLKGYGWTIGTHTVIADGKTIFQLHCKHRPHSVTVLHLGQEPKIKLVQCLEPQRLYDLMKAHDISCTTVWNSRISLFGASPCKALCATTIWLW
ncbi:uncharacterized protein LOC122870759 [Siniperca chuatsi]|uniref:uncharacterized protein LOC122870759 n=1 Tax=Siniperca chuatsi TaxID=119488 RepID=UPI001CE10D18|nr:uncharacterized protein LOC122870759 [Siniperca chuatsi]